MAQVFTGCNIERTLFTGSASTDLVSVWFPSRQGFVARKSGSPSDNWTGDMSQIYWAILQSYGVDIWLRQPDATEFNPQRFSPDSFALTYQPGCPVHILSISLVHTETIADAHGVEIHATGEQLDRYFEYHVEPGSWLDESEVLFDVLQKLGLISKQIANIK